MGASAEEEEFGYMGRYVVDPSGVVYASVGVFLVVVFAYVCMNAFFEYLHERRVVAFAHSVSGSGTQWTTSRNVCLGDVVNV